MQFCLPTSTASRPLDARAHEILVLHRINGLEVCVYRDVQFRLDGDLAYLSPRFSSPIPLNEFLDAIDSTMPKLTRHGRRQYQLTEWHDG